MLLEFYREFSRRLKKKKKGKRAVQLQIRFLVCVTYNQPWNTGSLEQSSFLEVLFTNILENNKIASNRNVNSLKSGKKDF